MYFKDSQVYMRALDNDEFRKKYFIEGHFIFFELGFTPLTLLSANFYDFEMAKRKYLGLTEVIDFA